MGEAALSVAPGEQIVECSVAGIVTLDDRGRVRLRSAVESILRALSLLVVDDMIQVCIDGPGGGELDERGRLTIPQNLLDAAGLVPGGRVAILELNETTLGLIAANRLCLRRRVAVA